MKKVFVSIAGRSKAAGQYYEHALRGLEADVFVYDSATNNAPSMYDSLDEMLVSEIQQAIFFVMIVEGTLGSKMVLRGKRQYVQWFELLEYMNVRSNNPHLPPPCIVDVSNPISNKAYREFIEYLKVEGIDYRPVESHGAAVGKVIRIYREHLSHSIISTGSVVSGYIDVNDIEHTILEKLESAIRTNDTFPQKYLYSTPLGAKYWSELCANEGSVFGQVRKKFLSGEDSSTFGSDVDSRRPPSLYDQIYQYVEEGFSNNDDLNIVFLGCGDGRRESDLARYLRPKLNCRRLNILLIDTSKSLVSSAVKSIQQHVHGPLNINFAIIDIEASQNLRTLLNCWCGTKPALLLLLGNTFGNIDSVNFLHRMSGDLRADDVLLLETPKAKKIGESKSERKASVDEPRFDFFTSPIRMLGILPKRTQLRVSEKRTDLGTLQKFRYQFTQEDVEVFRKVHERVPFVDGNKVSLCEIQAANAWKLEDAMKRFFKNSTVIIRRFEVATSHLDMLYGLMTIR